MEHIAEALAEHDAGPGLAEGRPLDRALLERGDAPLVAAGHEGHVLDGIEPGLGHEIAHVVVRGAAGRGGAEHLALEIGDGLDAGALAGEHREPELVLDHQHAHDIQALLPHLDGVVERGDGDVDAAPHERARQLTAAAEGDEVHVDVVLLVETLLLRDVEREIPEPDIRLSHAKLAGSIPG